MIAVVPASPPHKLDGAVVDSRRVEPFGFEHGVQIELPPRIRGNGPFWHGWDGGWPTPHTEDLVDGLVAALA